MIQRDTAYKFTSTWNCHKRTNLKSSHLFLIRQVVHVHNLYVYELNNGNTSCEGKSRSNEKEKKIKEGERIENLIMLHFETFKWDSGWESYENKNEIKSKQKKKKKKKSKCINTVNQTQTHNLFWCFVWSVSFWFKRDFWTKKMNHVKQHTYKFSWLDVIVFSDVFIP